MRRTWFCMLVACAPSVASAQGTQAPEAAIREHQAALAAAINRRDAAALALLFTADGDEINVDGPRTDGRDAIRAATQRELATWPSARRFTLEVTGVRMLTPDIAIVETTATFSEGPVQSNRGTSVVVRRDGKWLTAMLRVYPSAATRDDCARACGLTA